MQHYEIQINKLPISICCYENGLVSFNRLANFKAIVDQPEDCVQAVIDKDGITVGAQTEIDYGYLYEYKEMPELLAWLQSQKMEMPVFKKVIYPV